jgi:hypothetical protein
MSAAGRLDARALGAVAELGGWLLRAGQLAEARRLWEGIAAAAGHLEAPWRALAMLALVERRYEDCEVAASTAHERRPQAPAPLVLRGEARLRVGRYAEARRDLDAALALTPRSEADRLVLARASALRAVC